MWTLLEYRNPGNISRQAKFIFFSLEQRAYARNLIFVVSLKNVLNCWLSLRHWLRLKTNSVFIWNKLRFVVTILSISDFSKLAVLEVAREEEFSPLKNAKGTEKDNPETAKRDLCNLHYKYIVEAGGKFIDENGYVAPFKLYPQEQWSVLCNLCEEWLNGFRRRRPKHVARC